MDEETLEYYGVVYGATIICIEILKANMPANIFDDPLNCNFKAMCLEGADNKIGYRSKLVLNLFK